MLQPPVPLQPPPVQPLNVWFASGVAVSEMAAVSEKKLEQAPEGQLMPAGDDVTEPLPLIATVSLCAFAGVVNEAVAA